VLAKGNLQITKWKAELVLLHSKRFMYWWCEIKVMNWYLSLTSEFPGWWISSMTWIRCLHFRKPFWVIQNILMPSTFQV